MKPLRTYLMKYEEQINFDPAHFTKALKAAGFELERDTCPVIIKKPWDKIHVGDGAILWRQWEPTH